MTIQTKPFDPIEYLDSEKAIQAYLHAVRETNDNDYIAQAQKAVVDARATHLHIIHRL